MLAIATIQTTRDKVGAGRRNLTERMNWNVQACH